MRPILILMAAMMGGDDRRGRDTGHDRPGPRTNSRRSTPR